MCQTLCKPLGMKTLSPVPARAILTDKLNTILTVPKTTDTKMWASHPRCYSQYAGVLQNI